jgi:circadian clock protein KaiC
MGPTGAGKTTLGLHFLSEATPEAPALMFGFYESPARLRVRARGLGFDLDRMIDSGALELIWWPPAEIIPDEVVHEIVHRARVIGARRVFVDGLAALRDGLNDRERLPYIVHSLSHQLRDMGATVLYTLEIRELGFEATMPSDDLSAMIDNVLLLNLSRHDQAARRYLSIVKMRSGDFDPYTRQFHIGNRGFVLTVDERLQAFGSAE